MCPGEAQPRKGSNTKQKTNRDTQREERTDAPHPAIEHRGAACQIAVRLRPRTLGPPAGPAQRRRRPARQVSAGAGPGLGPNFGERPGCPAAPSLSLSIFLPLGRAAGAASASVGQVRSGGGRRPASFPRPAPQGGGAEPVISPTRGGGAGLVLLFLPPFAAGRAVPRRRAWLAAAARGSA